MTEPLLQAFTLLATFRVGLLLYWSFLIIPDSEKHEDLNQFVFKIQL